MSVTPLNPPTTTVESIEEAAKAEVNKELSKAATEKFASKHRQLAAAKKVVQNIEAELEVMRKDMALELVK